MEELGNPKNKKPAKLPQYFEVCEIMHGLMAANQDIPLPLWAKLIKFGLLDIKANDLLRRENELKAKEEKAGGGKGSGTAVHIYYVIKMLSLCVCWCLCVLLYQCALLLLYLS